LDLDRLAGCEISHVGAKLEGPIRLYQSGSLTASTGLYVLAQRLFLLADLADDDALAVAQGHVVHGVTCGQRQQVLRLAPFAARIAEALADAAFGDESADCVVDIAGQRNELECLAVPGRCLDRAEASFRTRRGG